MKTSIFTLVILGFLLLPIVPTAATMDPKPELTIVGIRGGIGLTVLVKNVGTTDATRVGYQLNYGGGFFLRTTKMIMNLPGIPVGETITVRTGFVRFGVGLGVLTKMPWMELTIFAQDAEDITKILSARTFGALVILQ
ncbi:MAG: hypothetical protein JXA75_04575 [Candidatus Thermoplasmatota archaeon]|nr:hypothetical protein [Candidatus Thermoplasmatota archaeon]